MGNFWRQKTVTVVFSQGEHKEGHVQPQLHLADKTALILMPHSDRSPFQDPIVLSALAAASTVAIVLEGESRLLKPATEEDMGSLVRLGASVGSALLADSGLMEQQEVMDSVLQAKIAGYSHPLFNLKK